MANPVKKVIVIGLDGLEPKIVDPLLEAGRLPHLQKLRSQGGFSRIQTTIPAQTPVAWSTFATGTNPGGHGIFDFIRRDPRTYLPDLALNRYEQKNAFTPPRAVNLRRGTPVWGTLSEAGVPSTILRCPCTYPPDTIRGRVLSGMGVPDLRGGLGTATFYSSRENLKPLENENIVHVAAGRDGNITTHLIGPRNPRTRENITHPMTIQVSAADKKIVIRTDGSPQQIDLAQGRWSDWVKVKFKMGLLQSVRGAVRFYLVNTQPHFELYASPVNFDAQAPMFPISSPAEYAKELEAAIGTYYTTGMVEDHGGLNNGRFDEAAYLQQCDQVLIERERMMLHELDRFKEGMFFCLFDTPDRVQHMLWRFGEPDHPANRHGLDPAMKQVIAEHYQRCDQIVGKALQHADDQTLVIVLSDHGFNSFQRGVHLNTWLHDHGFLRLKNNTRPGPDAGEFFHNVDWSGTQAYALGLGSVYLNITGREAGGAVAPNEADAVKQSIASGLAGLRDPQRNHVAVVGAATREQVYSGPYVQEAPDLIVKFAAGYRVSWDTALGGLPDGHFEDNTKRWSGDHIIDPSLVPGVLFMNRPFRQDNPRLVDMAPTILQALGVPKGAEMEGTSVLL